LTKGQVWRTGDAYLQVMDRGKRLISYKMMKERGKRAVRTQMSGIADVEAYLKANGAKLVETAAQRVASESAAGNPTDHFSSSTSLPLKYV
jgi:hypothetical protein